MIRTFVIFYFSFIHAVTPDVIVAVGKSLEGDNGAKVDLAGSNYLTGLTARTHDLLVTDIGDNHASIYTVQSMHNPANYTKIFQDEQSSYFESIAYSSKSDLIYATSPSTNTIIRINESGSESSHHSFEKMRPSGIVINPCTSTVYWSSTSRKNGSILFWKEGQSPLESTILIKDLNKPRGLAIDYTNGHLYWTEQNRDKFEIRRSRLDGSEVKTLVSETGGEPFSLGLSLTSVYWSDWKRRALWRVNKTGQYSPEVVREYSPINPNGVSIFPALEADCTESMNNIVPSSTPVPTTPETTNTKPDDTGSSEATTSTTPSSSEDSRMCMNGYLDLSGSCECDDGWTGKFCQVEMCHNYCISGNCSIVEGHPYCTCKPSTTGQRCELSVEAEPIVAQETITCLIYILPTIIAAQFIAIIVLAICLYKFRKRPRIVRKRFISASKYADKMDRNRRKSPHLNKNFSKEDQNSRGGGVQLDIEDCCNMAMCDTPCLEPPNRTPKKLLKNLKKSCSLTISSPEKTDRAALLDNNLQDPSDF